MRALIIALALMGCARHHDEPPTSPATPDQEITFDDAANRITGFLDEGFVVSLRNGQPVNQGDSLLFTGLAVYALDCDRGGELADALAKMVTDTGGALYRHPTLPDKVSFDGAVGFYRGVAKRVTVCGEGDKWAPLIAKHVAYMNANGGKLNAADNATLPLGFSYLRDRVAQAVGEGTASGLADMEADAAAWAAVDVVAHAACYRTHLALNTLQTVEMLGDKVTNGHDALCTGTAGANLPTVDHWCGRGDLNQWLTAFQYDVWQYRHQRCPGWESPDGGGDSQPAVDELVAWADLHGSPK